MNEPETNTETPEREGDCSPASCSEPPLGGRWHAGNGVLVNGTLRIAVASFDTDPPEDFQKEVFEWIAEKLNEAQNAQGMPRREQPERK